MSHRFRGGDNSEDADVDNIDFIENEEDEDDVQNGASAATNGGDDDDEIDPLDAFMEGIHEEMKSAPPPKPKAKAERYKDDDEDDDHVVSFLKAKKDLGLTLAADALNAGYNSDEEVYAAAKAVDAGMLEYDSDDNPIVVDKRKIEPIQALDHSSIDYEPINKDFYEEVEAISSKSYSVTLYLCVL